MVDRAELASDERFCRLRRPRLDKRVSILWNLRPAYKETRNDCPHFGFGDKMFLTRDIIELAIQIEQNAENVYRNALKKISDPKIVSILQWLADEEVEHARWFRKLKQTDQSDIKDPRIAAMGKSILSDTLGRQSFSLKDADFSKIIQLADLVSLVLEFEKDKVIFYKMLKPFIADGETLDFLENIIAEETHHIQELSTLIYRDNAKVKMTSDT
jgi:rubrerythrin